MLVETLGGRGLEGGGSRGAAETRRYFRAETAEDAEGACRAEGSFSSERLPRGKRPVE